jgi:hypothetical protein
MDKRIKDLTGQKFNRLTVVKFSHSKNRKTFWLCKCDCGNEKIVRSDSLKDESVKSCGCLNHENGIITHNMSGTKIYHVWASMKNRCNNPNANHYSDYGGRGINYNEVWETFELFYEWAIKNGYKEGLTLERIDVNGNYEPSNCKWITIQEQQNNKRDNVLITYKNKTQNIAQWARELEVSFNLLYGRLHKYNMDLSKVIKTL